MLLKEFKPNAVDEFTFYQRLKYEVFEPRASSVFQPQNILNQGEMDNVKHVKDLLVLQINEIESKDYYFLDDIPNIRLNPQKD